MTKIIDDETFAEGLRDAVAALNKLLEEAADRKIEVTGSFFNPPTRRPVDVIRLSVTMVKRL